MSAEQKALVFKALGDKNRLKILSKCQDEEMSFDELKQELELNETTLSQHLTILVEANLLKVTSLKKQQYYIMNKEVIAITKMFLDDYLNSNLQKQDL